MRAGASSSTPKPEGGQRLTPAGLVREPFRQARRGAILVAAAATAAVHLGLILAAPAGIFPAEEAERAPRPSLEVVLDPPEPPPPPEESFIVPNPEVPSNPPDEATHFAERDQQAAQEEPAKEDHETPEVEGEFEEPTQNIVEGIEVEPAPVEDWELAGDDFGLPGVEGRPIEGFEPVEGDDGTDVPVTEESVEEESDALQTALDLEGLTDEGEETEAGAVEEESARVPRPRPRLSQASSDPVGQRPGGATRVGTVAVDANFSEFGDYLTRMLEAIQRKWHDLAWDSLPAGEVGSVVAVSFRIDRDGEVHGLEVDRSTAGLTATLICKDAITSRQPYGAWSGEMREVLGDEQTVRIRFHYR